MKPTTRFFARRVPGVAATEYCLLNAAGTAVVATQMSKPDGVEIDRPAGLTWAVKPPTSSLKAERRGTASHLHQTRQSVSAVETKTCTACGKVKPISLFIPWRGGKPGPRCEHCREAGRYK